MLKLTIEQELTDLNNYIKADKNNRYGGGKVKKKQTEIVAKVFREAMKNGMEINPDDFPLDFDFKWFMKDKRKDKDNIVFAKKFIFDGMIESGIIKNDGWKEIGSFRDTVIVDKDYPRVEIRIKPAKHT